MVPPIADMLAAVERSPEAAGAHDRDGWIGLFGPDGRIEDPVGSRPHVGSAQIARFYDTFIGPRDITFHRGADVVSGHTVVRDLTLDVRMGASVTMSIPAFLRYDLDDSLNVVRLQAFWELPAMVWQFARNGVGALPAGLQLTRALLHNQRLAGTVGFLAGFRGVTSRAKPHLARLLDDACAGDQVAVKRRLGDAAQLTRGDDDRIGTSELVGLVHGARWDGMVRAGSVAVARLRRDGRQLVLFADVETRPTRIRAVRVFADEQWT
ncbi:nuclear transport factor 2 family protein [Mycobacterium hodleri]|uniref:nuclear transport factor 2 family protein n=1 Tax=Mycolicibacterium hodleri TaxID=49897 RepID=UPI0021F39ECB|nr:nuclear transport factor 2 family protein [Mycolicibacterium hodleri]MCV7134457.1 nuclear transport factor 2 family protein [Mycolicibacterium hodleri]